MSPSVVFGAASLCLSCVSEFGAVCLSACSCGHVCPCCSPEDLPGHPVGSKLHTLPWPPAQPGSQTSSVTLLPGPGLAPAWPLLSRGGLLMDVLLLSPPLTSPVLSALSSPGSFLDHSFHPVTTASSPDSGPRIQELALWVWAWPVALASGPVSSSTPNALASVTCRVASHLWAFAQAVASAGNAPHSFAWLTPTHPLRPKAGITSPGKSSLILSFHPDSGLLIPYLGEEKQVTCPRSYSW